MKANKFLFLVLLILMSSPNVAHAQFWQGFLYGVGQAAQNYNNQRQNSNRRSSDYYANKYGNGSSNSRTTEPEVTKTRKVEDDGFVWYRLRRSGGTYGIENANGDVVLYPDYGSINYDKESKNFDVKCESGCHEGVLSKSGSWIIPLDREYESLYYSDLDRYVVEKNGFKGICSTDGKEIIAPSKYSSIHLYDGIYYVVKDGYEGACDANGKEIIAPNSYKDILFLSGEFHYKNDDGDWISLNIDKYGNRISTFNTIITETTTANKSSSNRSSNSYTSSTLSSSSSSSSSDKPLYEGYYTESRRLYNTTTGDYIGDNGSMTHYVKIYDNYILVSGSRYDYKSTTEGWKLYEGVSWGGTTYYYKVNPNNYIISKYVTSYNHYFSRVETLVGNVVKGETNLNNNTYSNNSYSNASNNYNFSNSTNSSSSSSVNQNTSRYTDKTCHGCHGSGKCNTCNGKGWYERLGIKGTMNCPNCSNGRCSICGGTGKVRGLR